MFTQFLMCFLSLPSDGALVLLTLHEISSDLTGSVRPECPSPLTPLAYTHNSRCSATRTLYHRLSNLFYIELLLLYWTERRSGIALLVTYAIYACVLACPHVRHVIARPQCQVDHAQPGAASPTHLWHLRPPKCFRS